MREKRGPSVGELIGLHLQDIGMTKAEFGRRIDTSRQNVSLILKNHHINSDMLWKISLVLRVNFFEMLAEEMQERHSIGNREEDGEVEINLKVPNGKVLELLSRMMGKVNGL